MPLGKSAKKTIYILPTDDKVKTRLVYVETTAPGEPSFTKSFYIPGTARAYQLVANHGDRVKTWIKNIVILPDGSRQYSGPSDPVIFDIPPIEQDNPIDKPFIQVNHFPEKNQLAKDKDEFKKVCGVD
jgi:hypothetical protein